MLQFRDSMNIYFDARWTRTDYHDGVSRYTAGLVQGFKENNIPITLLIHDIAQLAMLPSDVPYVLINNPVSIKEFFVAYRLNKLNADVVFSPLQVMGFWGRKYKLVLTLQDIIYYHHPKPPTNLAPGIRLIWRLFHFTKWPQRLLLNRADYVTTVSKTSKQFIEGYGLTSREVGVIYNAPSDVSRQLQPNGGPKTDILYMGSFMPYKNAETLIKGMAGMPAEYTLHLLSKILPERKRELKKLVPAGTKVIFHNGVTDEEYLDLLDNAFCLATASKEEGFGLPIVEAQVLGVPVVCSTMDIFKEVAGNAALYFDASNPADFAKQALRLQDESVRADLIEKGFEQAQKFSWKSSAKTLYNIFRKIT